MPRRVRVRAARVPDRDHLLEALRDQGLAAEPEGEIGIAVPVDEGTDRLFHEIEGIVFHVGAPFVPVAHEGVIYVRPPVG